MTDIDAIKESHHGVGTRGVIVTCAVDGEVWPCAVLNLASELEAARKVVAAAREQHEHNGGSCICNYLSTITRCDVFKELAAYDRVMEEQR